MHLAHQAHALLSLGLLLQQLLLARDVSSVALGQHVLHHGRDVRRGDGLVADARLDRNLFIESTKQKKKTKQTKLYYNLCIDPHKRKHVHMHEVENAYSRVG